MKPFNTDISLEDVGRVKNSLDPVDPQDLVTKSWAESNISSGSGYQKYYIAPLETYTIPQFISSVITGPLEIDGILVIDGRLEVL